MKKFEQRKYNGGHFSPEIRQMTSYFAVKHQLWPADGDDINSMFSDNASRISSMLAGAVNSSGGGHRHIVKSERAE